MFSIFDHILAHVPVTELATKYRRASQHGRFLVIRHLSSSRPERPFTINHPERVQKFPKRAKSQSNGRKQKHFLELFNELVIHLDPERTSTIDFNEFAINLHALELPKTARVALKITKLDDTDKVHFAYMRTMFKVFHRIDKLEARQCHLHTQYF